MLLKYNMLEKKDQYRNGRIGLKMPMDGVLDGAMDGVFGDIKSAINTPLRTKRSKKTGDFGGYTPL